MRLRVFLVLLGAAAAAFPQQAPMPPIPPTPKFDAAWTREAWTADETPYLKVRREVEAYTLGRKVSQTKTDLCGQTERAAASWHANPDNPVILYRAAYYAYMLAGLDFSPEARAVLKAARLRMDRIASPHSREFARLRMLREGFLNEAYIFLGERLYKQDPNDREIALKLVWTHSLYRPGSRKRAVEIAERLLKTDAPKRYPGIYYAVGMAYHSMYTEEPNDLSAQRTIWGYRQYLDAGPAWRPKAIEVQDSLDRFEKYLADRKAKTP